MTKSKRKPSLTAPLYLLVRTRRSQKIHPRASRDRDGNSLWPIVKCKVHSLAQVGHNHTPSQNPAIHSYYAPLFSPLPNSHFSPSDILLLTQSTFSSVSQAGWFPTHSPLYIRLTNRLS